MIEKGLQSEIEELEKNITELIEKRKQIQNLINQLRQTLNNKKVYNKYYKSVISHKNIRQGATCQELFGKRKCDLTDDEKRRYYRIKQAERRARIKAERSNL